MLLVVGLLRMAHGLLVENGAEFFIRPRPAAVVRSGAAAADSSTAGGDTQPQRDAGPSSSSTGPVVVTEADTYRDFHAAFEVGFVPWTARAGGLMAGCAGCCV